MKIIKKVIVKQILTPKSKQFLKASFQKEKMQLERECQQLIFEKRKLIQRTSISEELIKQKFRGEINQRKEKIARLDFKLSQLKLLKDGEKLIEREVDALVEVKIGMNWEELMKNQTIIIKDGIVINIENE